MNHWEGLHYCKYTTDHRTTKTLLCHFLIEICVSIQIFLQLFRFSFHKFDEMKDIAALHKDTQDCLYQHYLKQQQNEQQQQPQ